MSSPTLKDMVFVFGSNTAGRHGAGAALYAKNQRGAVTGYGYGHYGTSFAIPTKDFLIETLPLHFIKAYIEGFLAYAADRTDLTFQVTQIGCGLAGFDASQIAPLFKGGQVNLYYDTAWKPYLAERSNFWGTA